ncbi:hypothetical protein ACFQO1_10350 [Jejudonia soesokkakensis]|uniref:Lipoprotein n=1 Tax=Jejudonia soesokkakensis TaxID=1323432 RepID=A0ABW2MWI3_9FLAO
MYKLLLLSIIPFFLISCNKNDNSSSQDIEASNYFALTLGNSWTYDVFEFRESSGNYEPLGYKIITSISRKKTINGKIFFYLETNEEGNNVNFNLVDYVGNIFVRDSLGYLVRPDGVIKFTTQTSDPYFINATGLNKQYGQYIPEVITLETPMGNFQDIDFNKTFLDFENGNNSHDLEKTYYKSGAGLVVKVVTSINNPNSSYFLVLTDSNVN